MVPEIGVFELATLLAEGGPGEVELIDVREPAEFAQAHVPGARLVPLNTVPAALDDLPRDRRVYVVCAVGARSAAAVDYLVAAGVDAVNVAGGTRAWLASGHPAETEAS